MPSRVDKCYDTLEANVEIRPKLLAIVRIKVIQGEHLGDSNNNIVEILCTDRKQTIRLNATSLELIVFLELKSEREKR